MIIDNHKDDKAIPPPKQQTSIWSRPVTCKTTAELKIYGSTSWEKFSKLKESHSVQTAEFAVLQGIDHKPAFHW